MGRLNRARCIVGSQEGATVNGLLRVPSGLAPVLFMCFESCLCSVRNGVA